MKARIGLLLTASLVLAACARTARAEEELPELDAAETKGGEAPVDLQLDPRISAGAMQANHNNAITARRKALRRDLTTLIDGLPGVLDPLIAAMPKDDKDRLGSDGLESINAQYKDARRDALEMRQTVSRRMVVSALDDLEKRFPDIRDRMFSLLYQVQTNRFFNDPERFKAYVQKQLDVKVAIDHEKKDKISAKRRAQLRDWEKELGGSPDMARLEAIYDGVGARQVDNWQTAILTAATPQSASSAYLAGVKVSEFKPRPKPQIAINVPTPYYEPASKKGAKTAPLTTASKTPPTFSAAVGSAEEISGSDFGRFMTATVTPKTAAARAAFSKIVNAVGKYSEEYAISPLLVMGFMGQESLFLGWDGAVHALSPAGAVGVMQLMPGTAQYLGVKDSHSVDQNVMGGLKLIHQLRDTDHRPGDGKSSKMWGFSSESEFRRTDAIMMAAAKEIVDEGRSFKAVWQRVYASVPTGVKNVIAGYNAGAGAVVKYGGVPHYKETMAYVPGVLMRYLQTAVDYYRATGKTTAAQTVALAP